MTVSEPTASVYVVSTPIGNLEDLSARALRVLGEVALIACEDTRRTAALCTHFGITTRRVSLHAHNETRRVPGLLERLGRGESIALVSDAGTPLLSDPGAHFVEAARSEGFPIVPVPGASALLAALVASGLPMRPFTFLGFAPRKGRARRDWIADLAHALGSLVIYEAPSRVVATLDDLFRELGPRRVAVARELTKRFEEIVRGRLGEIELPELRGEVTLIVEGADLRRRADAGPDLEPWIRALLAQGVSPRDVAAAVARATGLPRRGIYSRVRELHDEGE